MKIKVFFITVFFIPFIGFSQDFNWANEAGGNGSDQGYDITLDNNGNSYVCGWFSDTAWFGSVTLISHGLKDVFLAKYDSNGVFQWVQQGYGEGSNTAAGIALDNNGNIFITGWFEDEIHFGEEHLIAYGLFDMFVCKYSPEGDALWAQQTTGEQDNYGNRIAINPEGDVLVSGSFRHVVSFGNDIDFESAGDRDIFIANYSNAGEIQWAKQLGGKGEDRGYGIISDDNGNIYLTGFFNGICSFEDHNVYSPAITSVYVCKFDPAGNLTWVNHAFGNANDFARGYGIGIDDNNDVYCTGFFSGILNVGYMDTLYATGGQYDFDIFVSKFSTDDGMALWATKAGSIYMDHGRDIVVDSESNSYVTGFFNDFAEFGDYETESIGMADVFVAKFNSDGNSLWVINAGGTENDYGYGIDIDPNANIYISGIFTREALFGDHVVEGWKGHDIFVAKITESGSGIYYGTLPVKIVIYPNPVSENLTLHIEGDKIPANSFLEILNNKGQLLEAQKINLKNKSGTLTIDTSKFADGLYLLQINTPKGKFSSKFVVNH